VINIRIKYKNKVLSLPIFDVDKDHVTIIQLIDGKIKSIRLPYTAVLNPTPSLLRLLRAKGFIH